MGTTYSTELIMITTIQHVSFFVKNTQKSLHFYQDILGLKLDHHRPDLGYAGAWLTLGENNQIHLLELKNPDPTENRPEHGGRDRHVAFTVTHFEQLKEKLQQANIAYTLSCSGRAALFCRDYDGNTLEFIEDGDNV